MRGMMIALAVIISSLSILFLIRYLLGGDAVFDDDKSFGSMGWLGLAVILFLFSFFYGIYKQSSKWKDYERMLIK